MPCPAVIVVQRVRGTRGTTAPVDDAVQPDATAPAAAAPDGSDRGSAAAPTLRYLGDLEQHTTYGYRCTRCGSVTVPEPGAAAPTVCASCGTPDESPERLHLISCKRCGSWCIVQGTGRQTVCPNPECNASQGCVTTELGVCADCGTALAVSDSGAIACPLCRTQHVTVSNTGRHEVSADCGCEKCNPTLAAMRETASGRDRCPSCGDPLALNSDGIMACFEHGLQPFGVTQDQPEDAPSDGPKENTTNTIGETAMTNTVNVTTEDAGVVPYLQTWDNIQEHSLESMHATLGALADMIARAVEANTKYEVGHGSPESTIAALRAAETSVQDAMENIAVHARNLHTHWDPAVEALSATGADVADEVLGAR